MNIIIIILMGLLVLLMIKQMRYENFDLLGYEEGLPNEYRKIDYSNVFTPMWNVKEYNANMWEKRFPYMIKQRYSYTDYPKIYDPNHAPTIYKYANLVDLPIQLGDKYHAKMKNIYGTDYDDIHDQSTNEKD